MSGRTSRVRCRRTCSSPAPTARRPPQDAFLAEGEPYAVTWGSAIDQELVHDVLTRTAGPVRGGDAVDLEWRDGVLSSVVLHALATREVTIDVPGDGQVRIRRRVSLQAGETVVVAP